MRRYIYFNLLIVCACAVMSSCRWDKFGKDSADGASLSSTGGAALPIAPGYRLLGKNNKEVLTIRPRITRDAETLTQTLSFVTATGGNFSLINRMPLKIFENEINEPGTGKKVKAINFRRNKYTSIINYSIALSQDSESLNSITVNGKDRVITGRPIADSNLTYRKIPDLKQKIYVDVPIGTADEILMNKVYVGNENIWTRSIRLEAEINAVYFDGGQPSTIGKNSEIVFTAQINACLSRIVGGIDGLPVMTMDPSSGEEKLVGFVEGNLSDQNKARGMFNLQVRSVLNQDVAHLLSQVNGRVVRPDLSTYQNQFDERWRRSFCSPEYVTKTLQWTIAPEALRVKKCPVPNRITRDPYIYGSCRPDDVLRAINQRIEKDAATKAAADCQNLTIEQKVEQIASAMESRMQIHICAQAVDEVIARAVAKDAQCPKSD